MHTRIYIPPPNPVIREICEVKAGDNETVLTHFIPPFGFPELVFYIGPRHQIKNVDICDGVIKGQYDIPQKIDFKPGYHFVCVRLHPYGLRQLFGISARVLNNSVLDVREHELTAGIAALLENRDSLDTELLRTIFQAINQYPKKRISESTLRFFKLLGQNPAGKINAIISENGIEMRTLQRNFINEVGLSPKKFLRIIRMREVEEQFRQHHSWFEIISDFDFTDQSHLIREFKLLRQNTPAGFQDKKLFLSDQLPAPEYLQIDPGKDPEA